jgi:predicted thioredoxin/glutaredoxin
MNFAQAIETPNRENTLSLHVVERSDGTKWLLRKVSVGRIGIDARIAWLLREKSGGAWNEISAERAQCLLKKTSPSE